MYLIGLDALLGWLRLTFLRLPAIIALVALMAVSDAVLSFGLFASQFNWYHLP